METTEISLIDKLKTLEKDLMVDLDSETVSNRPAAEIKKRRAEETYFLTKQELQRALKNSVGLIVLKGKPAAQVKFVELAKGLSDIVTVDALALYKSLSAGLLAASGNWGNVDVDALVALQRRLNNYRDQMHMSVSVPNLYIPNFSTVFQKAFTTEEELANAVRTEIRYYNGDTVNTVALQKSITEQAIAFKMEGPVVPAVVTNAIEEEIPWLTTRLYGDRGIVVEVKDEVLEEDVIVAFTQLKTKLQGK